MMCDLMWLFHITITSLNKHCAKFEEFYHYYFFSNLNSLGYLSSLLNYFGILTINILLTLLLCATFLSFLYYCNVLDSLKLYNYHPVSYSPFPNSIYVTITWRSHWHIHAKVHKYRILPQNCVMWLFVSICWLVRRPHVLCSRHKLALTCDVILRLGHYLARHL